MNIVDKMIGAYFADNFKYSMRVLLTYFQTSLPNPGSFNLTIYTVSGDRNHETGRFLGTQGAVVGLPFCTQIEC